MVFNNHKLSSFLYDLGIFCPISLSLEWVINILNKYFKTNHSAWWGISWGQDQELLYIILQSPPFAVWTRKGYLCLSDKYNIQSSPYETNPAFAVSQRDDRYRTVHPPLPHPCGLHVFKQDIQLDHLARFEIGDLSLHWFQSGTVSVYGSGRWEVSLGGSVIWGASGSALSPPLSIPKHSCKFRKHLRLSHNHCLPSSLPKTEQIF